MIDFPPEFHGMVAAMWATYQPAILIWMVLLFAAVMIFAIGIVSWNIIRPLWSH